MALVFFYSRHYKVSVVILCFLLPTFVPWYFWGESLTVGYFVPGLLRYAVMLNATWLVNSAAHLWGNRPYDKTINPRENRLVALSAIGKETPCLYVCHCLVTTGVCMIFTCLVESGSSSASVVRGFHNPLVRVYFGSV